MSSKEGKREGQHVPAHNSDPTPIDEADLHWMSEVLREAAAGLEEGELPIAAVVVSGNQEVSRGRARDIECGNRTSHAELLAITGARLSTFRAGGLTLYSTLEPCVMCAAAALIEGIDRVVYALPAPEDGGTFVFDDPEIRARCFSAQKPTVRAGVCFEKALALFADYLRLWPARKGAAAFARAVVDAHERPRETSG